MLNPTESRFGTFLSYLWLLPPLFCTISISDQQTWSLHSWLEDSQLHFSSGWVGFLLVLCLFVTDQMFIFPLMWPCIRLDNSPGCSPSLTTRLIGLAGRTGGGVFNRKWLKGSLSARINTGFKANPLLRVNIVVFYVTSSYCGILVKIFWAC